MLFLLLMIILTQPADAERIVSVELTLQTRGVYKSILVTPKQTQVEVNGKQQKRPTPSAQWQAILKALQGVNLRGLSSLPVDVSRTAVDSALSARLRVATTTQTYESAPYDHPNPPAGLVSLIRTIVAVAPPASRAEFR